MKIQSNCNIFLTWILTCLIIFSGIFSCSDDNITNVSNTTTIEGTLNLPFEANGKPWAVLIDNDFNGDNGYYKIEMGTCTTEMNISYSIDDVSNGIYYVYAAVFVVSDGSQGPQAGDLFGIYGGLLPNNMPASPNANVSSSNYNFDIDLILIEETMVTDIDGNIYKTIEIGDQLWMAENLNVTHYRNGDVIPNVIDNDEWGDLSTGAYCDYDNDESNAIIYGKYYNWYVVDDNRNIAPEGWHVPTDVEWQMLIDYLGGESVAGDKMKDTGTTFWGSSNTSASNESGFTGLPGGSRLSYGSNYMGYYGGFWSSTSFSSSHAWFRSLSSGDPGVHRSYTQKQRGFSVRCVRD